MSAALIEKAKRAILSDIRRTLPGTGDLKIVVESHGGIEYFRQALELPEVQEALRHKRITASITEIRPLDIVKNHILDCLKNNEQLKKLTFQTIEKDADLFYSALQLPEVKREIQRKKVEVSIQVVDKIGNPKPDIVIASIEDARNIDVFF